MKSDFYEQEINFYMHYVTNVTCYSLGLKLFTLRSLSLTKLIISLSLSNEPLFAILDVVLYISGSVGVNDRFGIIVGGSDGGSDGGGDSGCDGGDIGNASKFIISLILSNVPLFISRDVVLYVSGSITVGDTFFTNASGSGGDSGGGSGGGTAGEGCEETSFIIIILIVSKVPLFPFFVTRV
jgi:hypothetical protein